ncbi:C40 family peptidase [Oribacterium sp. Sow4_G1_1]|uniref:C40 family peptidase n=1 Tax=Oribacterium sp. Sow4_G1_1 TaxID=3438794 RepID=UPI003F94E41E
MGSEAKQRILLISALVFCVLIMGLLIRVLVRGGKQEAVVEEQQLSSESECTAVPETISTESQIRRLTDQIQADTLQRVLQQYATLGIVKCDSYINFRSAPNQNDLTNIMGELTNGAAVNILEMDPEGAEGWVHVQSGGMDGYMSKRYLVTGEEAIAMVPELIRVRATVITDHLRMRSGPVIEDGNTVGSAAKGEKYEVLERAGQSWIKIAPDNIDTIDTCYMSADPQYVTIDYGLDEARTLNLKAKVLNMYDHLGVSLASDYINVRSSPKEDGINNIVGKFPGYAGCNILGEEDGWYKIQSGPVTGYVRKDLIATGDTAQNLAVQHAQVMAIVNTESLNVRSEASTDSKAWTAVTSGQRYNVLNQLDGWVQLELDAGDDDGEDQGAFVSTRDSNVTVQYALQEAIEYYPAVEAANAAMAFRNKIVNFACQFVGNRYVWGGTSLTHGCDCSGFTQSVLKNFGISVPRVSRDQARSGSKVTSANMRPGDLIFYANRSGTINHVGMYIGNGQVVNAASTRSGIRIYRWNYRTPVAIRNVIGD